MSLIFIGREGIEKYVEGDETKERPSQQFKAGVMVVKEKFPATRTDYQTVLDKDGKPELAADGSIVRKAVEVQGIVEKKYSFKPQDIGKVFEFKDENDVMVRYPLSFKKK